MVVKKDINKQEKPTTICELLKGSVERFGGKVALQIKKGDSYETLTYIELYEKSRSLNSFLISFGIKKGDRVALLCENRPQWAIVFFGILGCGGVVVGIDVKLKPGEIKHILEHSEAKILFTSSQFGGIQFDERIISVDEDIFMDVTSQTDKFTQKRIDPDDPAMLVYTSGTTGTSKAVMLTHNNIISNVLGAAEVLTVNSMDNLLSVLPLNHMFELVGGLLGPLYYGAKITYITNLNTKVIQETMKETKTSVMQGVPLLFNLIYKGIMRRVEETMQPIPIIFSLNMKIAKVFRKLHIGKILFRRVRKEFGGHIKFFASGGAALDTEVASAFECMGMPIIQGYGLTETSPIVSVNSLKKNKIGSVGKPLPGVNVKIAQDGEIVVSGPNVMKGYFKDPDASASVIKNQEFYTGDIGFLDKDGFLYITGRKKNVIVTSAGKNIYPEEIEIVLGRSPYISEICVVGRKQKGAELPFVFITPDYDYFGRVGMKRDDITVRNVLKDEIKNLSEDLAEYKRVSGFTIFKGEFPKTTTRKIRRYELQKIAIKKISKIETEKVLDDFARKLRGVVATIAEIPEERISLDSDLNMDLGIDSLLKVEILVAIEAKCGIYIPDELLYRLQTFGDIVEFAKVYEKEKIPPRVIIEEEENIYDFLKERSPQRKFIKGSYSLFFRILSKWYFNLEIKNVENIIGLESFIITPNHNSLLDVPIVLSSLPRQIADKVFSPAAKDYFFDRHLLRRWFIKLIFDTFPFDRHGNYMKGIKKCKHAIREGKSLILFPEGTRSISGELQSFKVGLGALAFDLGIPIVPTYIRGLHEAFGKGMRFPKPNKIEVCFGNPIYMDLYKSKSGKLRNYEIYKWIIEDVRKEILKLK